MSSARFIREPLQRTDERGARIRLAVGADAGKSQRVEERVRGRLVIPRLSAPPAELLVAPPQSPVHFLAPLRRQRLLMDGAEQLLGALERPERFRLPRVLHRADRLRGELTDLAAVGAGEQLAERPGPRGGEARVVERLAEQPARGAVLLALHQPHHDPLVRRPQPALDVDGQIAQRRVGGRGRHPALEPVQRLAQHREILLGVRAARIVGSHEELLGSLRRQRRELALVGRPLGVGCDRDGRGERVARARAVVLRLPRQRQDRPQPGDLGSSARLRDGLRGGDDHIGVGALLVEREAVVDSGHHVDLPDRPRRRRDLLRGEVGRGRDRDAQRRHAHEASGRRRRLLLERPSQLRGHGLALAATIRAARAVHRVARTVRAPPTAGDDRRGHRRRRHDGRRRRRWTARVLGPRRPQQLEDAEHHRAQRGEGAQHDQRFFAQHARSTGRRSAIDR
jgi:hypothetical protein